MYFNVKLIYGIFDLFVIYKYLFYIYIVVYVLYDCILNEWL